MVHITYIFLFNIMIGPRQSKRSAILTDRPNKISGSLLDSTPSSVRFLNNLVYVFIKSFLGCARQFGLGSAFKFRNIIQLQEPTGRVQVSVSYLCRPEHQIAL